MSYTYFYCLLCFTKKYENAFTKDVYLERFLWSPAGLLAVACSTPPPPPPCHVPYYVRRPRGVYNIITIDYVHGFLITYTDNIFFSKKIK